MTLAAVLVASLAGSLHCAAMCGGFATVAGGCCPGSRVGGQASYALGRLLAYLGLGLVAGWVGRGFQVAPGLPRLMGLAVGVGLVVMALPTLVGRPGWLRDRRARLHDIGSRPRLGSGLRARLSSLYRFGARRGALGAALIGGASGLLPCGWLWAYVAVAATTDGPVPGAAVMAAFWLGTVPALVGVGAFGARLAGILGRHAPRITAAAVLLLGVATLAGKLGPLFPGADGSAPAAGEAPCH